MHHPTPNIFLKSHLRTAAGGVLGLVLLACTTSHAGDILRGGAAYNSAPRTGGAAYGSAKSEAVAQARANATDALARTNQALQSVRTMQEAARRAAINGPNNLGLDPNHPGLKLPDVPNGLIDNRAAGGAGGLIPDSGVTNGIANPVTTWSNAKTPVQTTGADGRTNVTIEQTAQQALLNWQTFNIGKETTLTFDQSAGGSNNGQWIAFNKINDPSGRPSQILGSIKADGQVYVINQNGILFGGASQVNLHTLVASSLPINDNLISRGLLNNPDAQFLFSSMKIDAGSKGTPAFTPEPPPAGKIGDVVVQPGAVLSSPTTADHYGGRIALLGANVTNAGTISTPDGQTILAAGLQVGLAAHAQTDPSLRGLDVFVGAESAQSGAATNSGVISAERASVILAGKTVNQLGGIESSTSVSLNGRIDLLADYNAVSSNIYDPTQGLPPFLLQSAGAVTLGPGSVARILPDLSTDETVASTALPLNSQVNLRGLSIHLGTGSSILAPSATVSLQAGRWDYLKAQQVSGFYFTSSDDRSIQPQIYLDGGAMINVAGSTDVAVPVGQNILSVDVRGSELADSPLQRNGVIRGTTIQVDLRVHGPWDPTLNEGKGDYSWIGTPLANAKGSRDLIQRSASELTTSGGWVELRAGGSVVLQPGSVVDVSGGWIDYQGGMVQTTRLWSGGHLVDISQATPDQVYDGIYDGAFTMLHPKYGISETFSHPLAPTGAHFEEGYTSGAAGGTLTITAPSMALDGNLLGTTVASSRQSSDLSPPSSISLAFLQQDNYPGPGTSGHFNFSPAPPTLVFRLESGLAPVDPFSLDNAGNPVPLRADRQNLVGLSPDLLNTGGFGKLSVDNSDGDILIPSTVSLVAPAGNGQGLSSISLAAANITIDGDISAAGGNLSFASYAATPFQKHLNPNPPVPVPPELDKNRGLFTLGQAATLDVSGLVVDDRFAELSQDALPMAIAGGRISMKAYSANLKAGSSVDVSGGLWMSSKGKSTYGNAGKIEILAGQDPKAPSLTGGRFILRSELSGFSGAQGGDLSLQATLVQIGGVVSSSGFNGTLVDPDSLLFLSPKFFSEGGFRSFAVSGLGLAANGVDQYLPAISISPGTVIEPRAESLLVVPFGNGSGAVKLTPILQPQFQRTAVSLSFQANGVDGFVSGLAARGDFVMGAGSVIMTDPFADRSRGITISAQTATILGSIIAPGGSITISGGRDSTRLFTLAPDRAVATVHLGPNAVLSTVGAAVIYDDGRGYRAGSVLAGGNITVSGNILAERGAVLNVSGASDILDLAPQYAGSNAKADAVIPLNGSLLGKLLIPTRLDSDAGKIALQGGQLLFSDATLIGFAGGSGGLGASLGLSSGLLSDPSIPRTPLDITLTINGKGNAIPASFDPSKGNVIGRPIIDLPYMASSGGHVSVESFAPGGFDVVDLRGIVKFDGQTSVSAKRELHVADGGVIFANAATYISAPYVALGTVFQTPMTSSQQKTLQSVFTSNGPFFFGPTYGSGNLTVNADLIDIGNLSLQGIGNADLTARDIRGNGTLDVAGAVTLRAAQIYPPTAVNFTIAAYDYSGGQGLVNILNSGHRSLPLSAGGSLNIYASTINQGGGLFVPGGVINLGWDGVGTSPTDYVSGAGLPGSGPLKLSTVAVTKTLNLLAGSVTSVSLVDSEGQPRVIPYGLNRNGSEWIDPTGTDITAGGFIQKSINISGLAVAHQAGALIDIRGGGDLLSYQWIPGVGGSKDTLASTSSFAVIPGYNSNFTPYAPFANSSSFTYNNPTTGNDVTDPGYVNSSLRPGDKVYLSGGGGLSAGSYTLLPARYALLPGAFLVTPQSGIPVGNLSLPEGASLASGYRYNGLSQDRSDNLLTTRFEVAPQSVVLARSEYGTFYSNSFLKEGAVKNYLAVPRLPIDAGYIAFNPAQTMSLGGAISSTSQGGRGGLVDISSPGDIWIKGSKGSVESGLVLDASELNSFGAESLLIGGIRQSSGVGTTIKVTAKNISVDNKGAPLIGTDIILVANKQLLVEEQADIRGAGALIVSDPLSLGNPTTAGSGDGVLLRASSDPGVQITRLGIGSSTTPAMIIAAGAHLSGAGVILDSSYATSVSPGTNFDGDTLTLNSGQISIQLNNPGSLALPPTKGLILSGVALQTIQDSTQSLSLLSYSSIDIYGSGQVGSSSFANLVLHGAEIRGFNLGATETVAFLAKNITLDNTPGGKVPGSSGLLSGNLAFNADVLQLGLNTMKIDQYASVLLTAPGGILFSKSGGLTIEGALSVQTSLLTGAAGATETISSGGALTIKRPSSNPAPTVVGGIGSSLSLTAASIAMNSSIVLPSGLLTLHGLSGDLSVGGLLDVGGVGQKFFDLTKYTDGGQISLIADTGSVNVATGGIVTVSAEAGGGTAGNLTISVPTGSFLLDGQLLGASGKGGRSASLSLDVGRLPGGTLSASIAGFEESIVIRDRLDSRVTIDGVRKTHSFDLSADAGSILVTGEIDASGRTGGTINLIASRSVELGDGSLLTVEGDDFSSAGKGGAVSLEAGAAINGIAPSTGSSRNAGTGRFADGTAVVDIKAGSTINLGVKSTYETNGAVDPSKLAAAAAIGDFAGTLHLRAPQTTAYNDFQVNRILGNIEGSPSSIVVEGYRLYPTASIDTAKSQIQNHATVFVNATLGLPITLFGLGNALISGLRPPVVVVPGAEVINPGGNLTLSSDWDLSSFRFGQRKVPGVLTLRASGDLLFNGALSDGFDPKLQGGGYTTVLYLAPLMASNANLPFNAQSWSYRISAGADLSAADFHRVKSLQNLGGATTSITDDTGSLKLGKAFRRLSDDPDNTTFAYFVRLKVYPQFIRTGSGDIDISVGRDLLLLNPFATIYTAGTQLADATKVVSSSNSDFDIPIPQQVFQPTLGAYQFPTWKPQYSFAGGNVTIAAQGDIEHQTVNGKPDSERQVPTNWLYRRSYVAADGRFGTTSFGDLSFGDIASTTWWVDFSNFFEGIGTLGGGDVALRAGGNITNVDALVATSARMAGKDVVTGQPLAPSESNLVELGGGNLLVKAGGDIDGGIYYVERGSGFLNAGNSIHTNSTRAPSTDVATGDTIVTPETTWLPATLFLGKGTFDVAARGDITLGPVVNAFLTPPGVSNNPAYRTYFSTYAADSSVNVTSLGGSINLREGATLTGAPGPILQLWMSNVSLLSSVTSVASYEPWIRLSETSLVPFGTALSLQPGTFRTTAFTGDISLAGDLTLSPVRAGTLELLTAGAINGLHPVGSNLLYSSLWDSSLIIVSDANPANLPGITSALAVQAFPTLPGSGTEETRPAALASLDPLFMESGSTLGTQAVIQTKLALHDPSLLHVGDADPVRIYASGGNIADLTLFSPKATRILASEDITDVGLYLQNVSSDDVSVVSAGRDIVAYNPNAPMLRRAQDPPENLPVSSLSSFNPAQSGDIQITGPGTLEVLAGRNIDLGSGRNTDLPADLGAGIVSIGNSRNPALPSEGARVVIGAGIGGASDLTGSQLDFQGFIDQFVAGPEGARYLAELEPAQSVATFNQLSSEEQAIVAMDVFYLVLRDAGRDHNVEGSAGFGTYATGFSAIDTLFGTTKPPGEINLSSRSIKTSFGGDISMFTPGGGLTLGFDIPSPGQVPPGIVTENGGDISIFSHTNVQVGALRIFTLRGGSEMIWSSTGDIAAGNASKTVKTAPPTRVVIDVQSADVTTDLAGLATGGGIGVLATRGGVTPGDVDLIAPAGVVDAGDAGIRATGNLNIAAVQVLNASNIQAGGASTGVPTTTVAAPNLAGIASASNTAAAGANAAQETAREQSRSQQTQPEEQPSTITVEVIGYGGGDGGTAANSPVAGKDRFVTKL